MKSTKCILLALIPVMISFEFIKSPVEAQREVLNGWERFQDGGNVLEEYFRFESRTWFPESVIAHPKKDYISDLQRLYFENLQKSVQADPVFTKISERLDDALKKSNVRPDLPAPIPEWRVIDHMSLFDPKFRRNHDIWQHFPKGESAKIWIAVRDSVTGGQKDVLLDDEVPYKLAVEYSKLIATDVWYEKVAIAPLCESWKELLGEEQFDRLMKFSVNHVGIGFESDCLMRSVLNLDESQRQKYGRIFLSASSELKKRLEEWKIALEAYEESDKTNQDLIKLKKMRRDNRKFQFETEDKFFEVLNEDQQEMLKNWRHQPGPTMRYVREHDVWVIGSRDDLFELPNSSNDFPR